MPSLIYNSFRVDNALHFFEDVGQNNYYLFFGKNTDWSVPSVPDIPTDKLTEELISRGDILGIKKITSANVAFVIPRIDWEAGTIYSQYSDSVAGLDSLNFYVMTDEYNVYKCLSNSSGELSTIKPTGTSINNIQTGDGYIWKFMYNIPAAMVASFVTKNWIPVPYDFQKSLFQISVENSATYVSGSPLEGHGKSSIYELFAKNIMISEKLEGSEDGAIPIDDYRQIGIIKNIKLNNGNLATGVAYTVNIPGSTVNVNSGNMIYVENMFTTNRTDTQTELYQIIIEL